MWWIAQKVGDQTVDGNACHAQEFIWRLWKATELFLRRVTLTICNRVSARSIYI